MHIRSHFDAKLMAPRRSAAASASPSQNLAAMFANTANKLAHQAVQSPSCKRTRLSSKSADDTRHITWKTPVTTIETYASPRAAILASESPRPTPSASPKPQPSPSPSPSTSAKSPLFSPAPDTVTEHVHFTGKAALQLLRDAAQCAHSSTKEIPVSFKLGST